MGPNREFEGYGHSYAQPWAKEDAIDHRSTEQALSQNMPVNNNDGGSDSDATRAYLELIRGVHHEWRSLEEAGDRSLQLSDKALSAIKSAVRTDARHGTQIQMPATDFGAYTVSEQTVKNLIRETVDSVPGALALATSVISERISGFTRERLQPTSLKCRISVQQNSGDLLAVAEQVRMTVTRACAREFSLSDLVVDVHVEDIHE